MSANLAASSQMAAFITNMRIVREFGNYCIANRAAWNRQDELNAKCDAGTITATEALELLQIERKAR